jgi:hypothetical protein
MGLWLRRCISVSRFQFHSTFNNGSSGIARLALRINTKNMKLHELWPETAIFLAGGLFAKTERPNRPIKDYSLADLVEIEQWPEYNGAKFMPPECRQPSG